MTTTPDTESRTGMSLREHVGWLIIYLILTCLMTFPVVLNLSDHIPGAGDPVLTTWYLDRNMDWFSGAGDGAFYDSPLLYPYPSTAAYSEHFIGTSLLALPLRFLTGGHPLLIYNIIFLAGFLFTAYGMHLLVFDWCRRHCAAFSAALVFSFVPFRVDHIVHLHMVTAGWVPFSILFLSRYLKSGRRKDLALFGLCFLMNALSSCFYMVALSLILFLIFPFLAWPERGRWKRLVPEMMVVLFLIGMVLAIIYKPYLDVQDTMGFERDARENVLYSARIHSWLGVPGWQANSLLYGEGRLNLERFTDPECALFPGVLACAGGLLALWAGIRERRFPPRVIAMSVLVLAGLILSFGPWFNRNPEYPNPFFEAVFSFFPGASSMRTPARYSFLVYTGLAGLCGYSLSHLRDLVPEKGVVFLWSIPTFMALEYLAIPLHVEKLPDPGILPDHIAAMKEDHPDPVFIEYPLGSDVLNREVTYGAIAHDFRTVNGYTSFYPPAHHRLMESANAILTDESLGLLMTLGVTHLVVDREFSSSEQRKQLERFASSHGEHLRHLKRYGKKDLYRLTETMPAESLPDRVKLTVSGARLDLPQQIPVEGKGKMIRGRVLFNSVAYPSLVYPLVIPLHRQGRLVFRNEQGKAIRRESITLNELRHGRGAAFMFRPPSETGAYTAELDIRDGRPIPTQKVRVTHISGEIEKSLYRMTTDLVALEVEPGGVVRIPVQVRNAGSTFWTSRLPGETGEVRVGYRLKKDGGVLRELRALLPRDVAPGEEVDVTLEFRAPSGPGLYDLSISLLAENMTWFEAEENEPLTFSFSVR